MAPLIIVVVASLLALQVRQCLGFGFSLLYVPITTLGIGFSSAVTSAVLLELLIGCLMVIDYRAHIRLLDSVLLKLFGVVGVGLGLAAVRIVPPALILAFSMLVLIIVCLSLLRSAHSARLTGAMPLAVAGILSGSLNAWSSLSGPPIVLYYLLTERHPDSVRGALSGYFLLLYVITALGFYLTGRFDHFPHGSITLLAASFLLLLFSPSRALATQCPMRFRRYSLYLILSSAVLVLLHTFIPALRPALLSSREPDPSCAPPFPHHTAALAQSTL